MLKFDAYTGSKIAYVDISSLLVRMTSNPIGGHSLIAIMLCLRSVLNVILHSNSSCPNSGITSTAVLQ